MKTALPLVRWDSFRSQGVLAPSLLSADFGCLLDEVKSIEGADTDLLHVDVMDGHFVPNLTIGPIVVESLARRTSLPLDCHLMVSEPEKWIEPFAQAGASIITVHCEASVHLNRLLAKIRETGLGVGVSLNPSTPLSAIEEVLDLVDLVLVMSVNPGFGGQKFIDSSLEKIRRLADLRGSRKFCIEVDGGVGASNIRALRDAGADIFVAGQAVFGQKDRAAALKSLKEKLR